MQSDLVSKQCPSCHGRNLRDGKFGVHWQTFIPLGRWMPIGYHVLGFVCVDCGFVGHFLTRDQVQDITRKQP